MRMLMVLLFTTTTLTIASQAHLIARSSTESVWAAAVSSADASGVGGGAWLLAHPTITSKPSSGSFMCDAPSFGLLPG